jgi:hypothetical protein
MRGRRLAVVAAIAGAVLGATSVAVAGNLHHGQKVGASPQTSLGAKAGPVSQVVVRASDFNDTSNSSTTLSLIPGMSAATVTVPRGRRALLDIRFSAEISCSGGTSSDWCIAEILVDGIEAAPGDGSDYAIDSTDNSTESVASWEGHAMERVAIVGPGTHTVRVIGGVTDFNSTGSMVFWTGERTLVIDRSLF